MVFPTRWTFATRDGGGTASVDRKTAAPSVYRTQYPLRPDTLPRALPLEMFGIEYFVQARPCRAVESEILRVPAAIER